MYYVFNTKGECIATFYARYHAEQFTSLWLNKLTIASEDYVRSLQRKAYGENVVDFNEKRMEKCLLSSSTL